MMNQNQKPNPRTAFWNIKWEIPGTPWKITGYSKAAYRTGFYIPALSMMLDAGPQNFCKPEHIFITHMHVDHVANLPFTLIDATKNPGRFNIYGPLEAENYLKNYINSMHTLNSLSDVDISTSYTYTGFSLNNSEINYINKKIHGVLFQVGVIKCHHSVPTVSYLFTEVKKKLKPEYKDLTSNEIIERKLSGTEITSEVEYPRFAYICDTYIKVLTDYPQILTYPVIFIECTFLYEDEYQNAHQTQHIHWKDLKPYVKSNPQCLFVLIHFSLRYTESQIDEFFQEEFQSQSIQNVKLWI